jgi:ribosome recycling factor|tara:strand:- start:355 stop:519 length:165 start_codon:yes stop_codon:yes gene_type:complete
MGIFIQEKEVIKNVKRETLSKILYWEKQKKKSQDYIDRYKSEIKNLDSYMSKLD